MTDLDLQKFINFREQLEKLVEESGLAKEAITNLTFTRLSSGLRNFLLKKDYRVLTDRITDDQFSSLGYSVVPKSEVSYSFDELYNFLSIFPRIESSFKITENFRTTLIIDITESESNFHLRVFDNYVSSRNQAVPLYLYKLDYKSLVDSIIDAVSTPYELSLEDILLLYEDVENNINKEGVIRLPNLLK